MSALVAQATNQKLAPGQDRERGGTYGKHRKRKDGICLKHTQVMRCPTAWFVSELTLLGRELSAFLDEVSELGGSTVERAVLLSTQFADVALVGYVAGTHR